MIYRLTEIDMAAAQCVSSGELNGKNQVCWSEIWENVHARLSPRVPSMQGSTGPHMLA